jgi:pyridoxamine 5'-phosphate oxidase
LIDFSKEPLDHFHRLYQEAVTRKVIEPNAMSLATVSTPASPDKSPAQPSVRIVYYKGTVRGGLSFYTNYEGKKAQDMAANPQVCVNFFWGELSQQIRINGHVEKLTRSESEAYFKTRARLSQAGAWASHQSEEIPSYQYFQDHLQEVEKKYAGVDIPCPPGWGGYRIEASRYEFWFGHSGRLHERYVYEKSDTGWKTKMVAP